MGLFYVRGLSYQRIADFLDIPLGTVKRRLSDARGRLQAVTGGILDEDQRRRCADTVHHLLERALQADESHDDQEYHS